MILETKTKKKRQKAFWCDGPHFLSFLISAIEDIFIRNCLVASTSSHSILLVFIYIHIWLYQEIFKHFEKVCQLNT